jgi:hypothetical protein
LVHSKGAAAKREHFAAALSEKRLLTPLKSNFARLSRAKPPFSGFCKAEKGKKKPPTLERRLGDF